MRETYRRFLDGLARTETTPPDSLARIQARLVEPLARHAAANVPFYRERLDAVLGAGGGFDFTRWREIPVFTRAEAQQAGPALFAERVPENSGGWAEGHTSGSTGRPFQHRRSELADVASVCQTQRDYDWYGLDFDQPLAAIRVLWRGNALEAEDRQDGEWNLRGRGRLLSFDIRTTLEQQVDWLRSRPAPYLLTYPSLLKALAERTLAGGAAGIRFDTMLTAGETITPEVRSLAQRAFGGTVRDRYGANEVGHMAAECPLCGLYHVSAESVLFEVLREDGSAAAPGEVGRVVVTALFNYATPLIRYEIGDLAEVGPAGQCRRTLPTLARILGRTRNVFVLRDGSRVWPAAIASEFRQFLDFTQVQVVQTGVDCLEIRYVVGGAGTVPDEAGLAQYFRTVVHPSLQVKAVPVERIERSPSGKFEDYISLVAETTRPSREP